MNIRPVPTLEPDGRRSEALLVLDSSGRLGLLSEAYELRDLLAVREMSPGDWRWLPSDGPATKLEEPLPGRIRDLLTSTERLLVSSANFVKAGAVLEPEALAPAFSGAMPLPLLSQSKLTVHQRPSESTVFFLNDLSFAMGSSDLRVRLGQARGEVVFFLKHPDFYVALHDAKGNWKLTVEFTCPLPPVLPRPDWTGRSYGTGQPSELAWRGCVFSTTPAFLPFARPPYAISPRAWSLALPSRYEVYSLLTDLHAACLSMRAAGGVR